MSAAGTPEWVRTEALAVVDRYLVGINQRDTDLIRDAFNFPHARIAVDGSLSRYEGPLDYTVEVFLRSVRADGWHHTTWDRTEVVFAGTGKAHVAVNFSRYREDGSLIGRYFSLYVVTCVQGHWGIQFGSGGPAA